MMRSMFSSVVATNTATQILLESFHENNLKKEKYEKDRDRCREKDRERDREKDRDKGYEKEFENGCGYRNGNSNYNIRDYGNGNMNGNGNGKEYDNERSIEKRKKHSLFGSFHSRDDNDDDNSSMGSSIISEGTV